MPPSDAYRGRRDDRGYDDYARASSYRARDRSSDYDNYRRAPSSHSHLSYHDRPGSAHYDQPRAPPRISPEHDSYYDRDQPREYHYDDRRRGSRLSRSRSPRRNYRHEPGRQGYRGASYDSQEYYMVLTDDFSVPEDYHPADRSQSPYRRNDDRPHRRGSHQSDQDRRPQPQDILRYHARNAEHDTAYDGQHTQFLLVSGLSVATDEEALAAGLAQLYKTDEDASAAVTAQPAAGSGLRSTGLKPTSVPRNPGAKKDSLKRVFLIREKMSRLSCGYGLAEFHSKEEAKAAYEKFGYEKGLKISSTDVTIAYAHLGVFVPARDNTPDEYSHLAGSDTTQRFEYRIPRLFASQRMVSENPPEDPKAPEVSQMPQKGGSDESVTDQGDKKAKKRKAEDGAAPKTKSRMTISAFDTWKQRQAELGPAQPEKPALLPTDPLIDFAARKCYLCARQFKDDTLNAHVEKSAMHKQNLTNPSKIATGWQALKKAIPSTVIPTPAAPDPEFRDRARERRRTHNNHHPTRARSSPSPQPSPPSPPQQPQSIGAKLLAKAGYVPGEGLGARGDGIAAPIETQMYRQGVGLGAEGGRMGEASAQAAQRGDYVGGVREGARGRFREMVEREGE